jgi:predicted dehydrogenase
MTGSWVSVTWASTTRACCPRCPDVELVGVADLVLERAQAAVGQSGAEALTDFRALLGRIDAVVVAVPTVTHVESRARFSRAAWPCWSRNP